MSFGSRLEKKYLIHPSDKLIGSVPLVQGEADSKQLQAVLDKMTEESMERGSVVKYWKSATRLEVYVSRRVSANI